MDVLSHLILWILPLLPPSGPGWYAEPGRAWLVAWTNQDAAAQGTLVASCGEEDDDPGDDVATGGSFRLPHGADTPTASAPVAFQPHVLARLPSCPIPMRC
jgi:hypothetical protein